MYFQNIINEVELRVTNDDITEFCFIVEVFDVGIDTIILDCFTWSFIDFMGVKVLIFVSVIVVYMQSKVGFFFWGGGECVEKIWIVVY